MPAEWPGGRREEDSERASRLALREFLHDEAAGGVVLLLAAAVALVWANSGAADSYVEFWHHVLTLGRGSWAVSEDLQHWVNDGVDGDLLLRRGPGDQARAASWASCAIRRAAAPLRARGRSEVSCCRR